MNNQLIVLSGISGSGKSTWANEQVKKSKKETVVVSRDKLRECLFSYSESNIDEYYAGNVGYKEQQVTEYLTTLIRKALNSGCNVIVDNTHTQLRYLNFYRKFGVPVSFKLFDISVDEAVKRQDNRIRKVGRDVIQKQYDQLQKLKSSFDFDQVWYADLPEVINNPNKTPCYVFDVDGTLAQMQGRSPYEWDRVDEDKYSFDVGFFAKLLNTYCYKHTEVIICTGRDFKSLDKTVKWLTKKGIGYDKIYIREENDQRPDWLAKQEFWEKSCEEYYIMAMYDDRTQVVDHARRLGFKCYQVQPGDF